MAETENKPKRSLSPAKIILFALLLVSLVVLLWVYGRYRQVKNDLSIWQDPAAQQLKAQEEARGLAVKVARLMNVPDGEPTVATIMDAESLAREQSFFKNAKNGDKVLIYGRQAIIYDPIADSIVNSGPVLVTDDKSTSPTLEIRNGSRHIGAADDLARDLIAAGFTVAVVGNAANLDYQALTLVNLRGKDVAVLADSLRAEVVDNLPNGELGSSQDVLIIVGNK